MNREAFDAISRHAAQSISRRASLLTLGGAALTAAVAQPGTGLAKKKKRNRKKDRKKCKKKAKQRCNQDTVLCKAHAAAACGGEATCTAIITGCCAICSTDGFFGCLLTGAM